MNKRNQDSLLSPKRVGPKLRKIREELGLSQGEMLKALGYGDKDSLFRSSISGYELGNRIPPLNVLLAYAKIANINTDVLIDDELDLSPGKIPYKIKDSGKASNKS